MAKKKAAEKTNGVVDEGRGHVEALGNTRRGGEAQPPPAMSASDLKSLFRTWQASTEQVDKARADLESKLAARSKIVEQIAAGAGKGPFGYKGQVLTISCRVNKTTGESTWFFKGPSKSDLTEVS